MKHVKILLAVLFALLCMLPAMSMAETLVTTLTDLQAAIGAGKTDIVLGGNIVIEGSVTINGNGLTLTRKDGYTDTLFTVKEGATLALRNLTIDGGNDWTMDMTAYNNYLQNQTAVPGDNPFIFHKLEAGAPVANKPMIVVGGNLKLNGVTIKNHVGGSGHSVIDDSSSKAVITTANTTITHCATTYESTVVGLNNGGKWNINAGTVITGNHGGRNGAVCRTSGGAKIVMNGGSITNNTAVNANGTVFMIYHSTFEMNGGVISGNSGVRGEKNGRNSAIYGHSTSTIVINDGVISDNTGRGTGGIDAPYTGEANNSASVTINGGTFSNNIAVAYGESRSVNGGDRLVIYNGTFQQDVSRWLAPGLALHRGSNGLFTVIPAMPANLPRTGDSTPLLLLSLLMISALCGFVMLRKRTINFA